MYMNLPYACYRLGGFGEGLKKLAKQVQGALPIVGLLSRLTSTGGGIGSDEMVCLTLCNAC